MLDHIYFSWLEAPKNWVQLSAQTPTLWGDKVITVRGKSIHDINVGDVPQGMLESRLKSPLSDSASNEEGWIIMVVAGRTVAQLSAFMKDEPGVYGVFRQLGASPVLKKEYKPSKWALDVAPLP